MKSDHPDFALNRPGALIAALPAVLGFIPEKSLVLVGIDRGEMDAVMRIDLSDALAGATQEMVEVVTATRADAVIAVIVDAEGARCPMCNDDYERLCADLADQLAQHDVTLVDSHVVDRIAAGGRWHCTCGCGMSGTVDDPRSSPLSATAVLDGRRLYGNRAELESVIAVDLARNPRAIAQAVEELAAGGAAARRQDPDGSSRIAVQDAMAASDRLARGGVLSDIEIAALAYGLTDLIVRDTLYALAIGEAAGAAEELWAVLSRALPAPWRAEALTLLAFFAYARGDGPLAGIALAAALRINPLHRMAGMLDKALRSGMRPRQIRQLALTGYRLAERIGAQLPPLQSIDQAAG